MKESQFKMGRLVQCFCSECNLNQQGFQWTLPRTKSKHVLYDKSTRNKNEQDIDLIEKKLAFISINNDSGGIIKKKTIKPAFRISTALQKKFNQIGYTEALVVLKEFTVTSSPFPSSSAPGVYSQDNIPITDYY